MRSLTLDQVREAGRPANYGDFAPDDWQYRDGEFWQLGLGNYKLRPDDDPWIPQDGWHHLPGCDCEFCRP